MHDIFGCHGKILLIFKVLGLFIIINCMIFKLIMEHLLFLILIQHGYLQPFEIKNTSQFAPIVLYNENCFMRPHHQSILASSKIKLVLRCYTCLNDEKLDKMLLWKKNTINDPKELVVHLDGTRTKLMEDLSLVIETLDVSDSGLYKCGNNTKYLVDVVEKEPTETLTRKELLAKDTSFKPTGIIRNYLEMAKKILHFEFNSQTTFYIKDEDLIIYNNWNEWSHCDHCNVTGQARKIGICTVANLKPILNDLLNQVIIATKEKARKDLYKGSAKIAVANGKKNTWGLTETQILERNKKLNQSINDYLRANAERITLDTVKETLQEFNFTMPNDVENRTPITLLEEYPWGIPCRSHYLDRKYKERDYIKSRESVIVFTTCQVNCSDQEDSFTVNKLGNKSLPKVPKLVGRAMLFTTQGSLVEILCPNNEGHHLIWHVNEKEIKISTIEKESKGRIKIDWNNNLIIQRVAYSDSGIYSCWNDTLLIGTVRVQVTQEYLSGAHALIRKFPNLGMIITFMIFILIGFGVIKKRTLRTKT